MPLSDWVRKLFRKEGSRAHGPARRPDDFVQLRVRRMEERRVFSVTAVTPGAASAVNEGTATALTGGTYRDDSGTNDSHTITVNWGDATPDSSRVDSTVVVANTDNAIAQFQHTYANDGTYNVTVSVKGADNVSVTSSVVQVTVNNVAPVLAGANNLTAIDEDVTGAANTGTLVSTLLAGQVTDFDSNVGIAVTGVTNTNGTWQYSTDGGGNWSALTGASPVASRLLASTSLVRFVPNADYFGTATGGVAFRAWDGPSANAGQTADTSITGGATAFSSAQFTSSITVNAVNDAPVRTAPVGLTSISVNEDSAPTTAVTLGLGSVTYDQGGNGTETGQTLTVTITNIPAYVTLWNGSTQVLTGTATATLTVAELQTLKYKTVADANGTGNITWTVQDNGGTSNGGSDSLSQSLSITVVAVADPPTVTTTGGATTYSEGSTGEEIDPGVTVSDPDTAVANSATITIVNYVAGEDQLVFVGQNGITQVSNTGGVLTISGAATLAEYTTALQSIKYHNSSSSVTAGDRTISFTVVTGGVASSAATKTVTVVAVNDAPSLAGSNGVPDIDEDITNAANTGTLVSDIIAGQFSDTDGPLVGIAVVNASNAFGTWQYATDGVTWNTLTGVSATAARLLAADATTRIRFVPNANFNGTVGGIQIRAWDGYSGSAGGTDDASSPGGTSAFGAQLVSIGITVNSVNDAPVRSAGNPTTINVNQDSTNVTAASLGLSGLAYTNGGGTTETSQTLTYTLTSIPSYLTVWKLDGVTQVTAGTILSLADLQGLKYKTVAGASGTGTLTWTVKDDGGTANGGVDTLTETLTVNVNATPVLPAVGVPINYAKNQAATPIDAAITITDGDSANMSGAVITLTNQLGTDALVFTNQNGITGVVTDPVGSALVLTLSGTATRAQYEAALQSVSFLHTGGVNATDRILTFQVTDSSGASSAVVNRTVHIGSNQPPVITTTATSLAYTENAGAVVLDGGVTVSDPDDTFLSQAVIKITGNYVNGEDVLAFANQSGISGSWNASTGTLTLTGNSLLVNYRNAIRSVTYTNTSDAPSTLQRTVTFTLNDGEDTGPAATRTIDVTAINDPPTRTSAAPTAISVLEDSHNTAAISLGLGGLTYGNGGPDETTQTLTYTITSIPTFITLFQADGTTPVVVNQVLTITELRGLTYKTVPDANGAVAANLTWTVKDDGGTANGGTDTLNQALSITVTAVNDAPVLTSAPPAALVILEDSATAATSLGFGAVTYGPGGGADESAQTLTFRFTSIPSSITLFLADGTTAVTTATNLTYAEFQGLTYKTVANANGTATNLTWTVTDNGGTGNGGSNTLSGQSMSVTVTPVNDAPVLTSAAPAALVINEDSAPTATSLGFGAVTYGNGGGTDESIQTLTFRFTSIPSSINIFLADGTTAVTTATDLTYAQFQSLTYKTVANANNTATNLTWTVKDDGGLTNGGVDTLNQSRSITVTAVNDAPVLTSAPPAALVILEDSATAATSLGFGAVTYGPGGGADESAQTLTFRFTSIPSSITLFLADGTTAVTTATNLTYAEFQGLTYKTVANANGTATNLTWTVTDNGGTGNGGSNTLSGQSMSVTVTPVNDAPVLTSAAPAALVINEDSAPTATSLGFGAVTYGNGGGTDESIQTLTFRFTSIPSSINIFLADGTTAVTTATDLTYAQFQSLTYKTVANANNTATNLTWTVKDDGGLTNGGVDTLNQSRSITVTAVNDAPVLTSAPPAALVILEDSATAATSLGFGAVTYGPGGGADESAQTLTFRFTSIPSSITLFLADGTTAVTTATNLTYAEFQGLTYKTVANANGTATNLTWTVTDNGLTANGGSDTLNQSLSITVTPVNDVPVRTTGTVTAVNVDEDSNNTTAVSLGLTGLTYGPGGGSDEALQPLTYKITAIPSNITLWKLDGTTQVTVNQILSLADLQGLKYKTIANANGTGNITWAVQDNGGLNNGGVDTLIETLAVTVNSVNDPPTIAPPTQLNYTIRRDETSGAILFSINDIDDPFANLVLSAASTQTSVIDPSQGGVVVFNDLGGGARSVQFNPNGSGTTVIRITVTDPSSASAYFDITVKVNDPPVFTAPPFDIVVDEDTVGISVPITVFDTETAAGSLTVTATSRTADQAILPNANIRVDTVPGFPDQRIVVVTPTADSNGEVYVTVSLADGDGAIVTATYKITIRPVNDAPRINAGQSLTTREDVPETGRVLADPGPQESFQSLTYAVVTGPQHGSLSFNTSTGAYTYTPTANYSGADSFTFSVTDDGTAGGPAITSNGLIPITITPVADAPTIPLGFLIAGDENSPFTTGLVISLTDTDGSEQLTWVTVANVDPRIQLRAADGVTPLTPIAEDSTTHVKTYRMLWADFQTMTVFAIDNLPGQALTSFSIKATSEETSLPVGDPDRVATTTQSVNVLIRNVPPNISGLTATNVDSNASTSLASLINDAPLDTFNIEIRWGISKTGFPQTTTLVGLTPGALISQSFTFLIAPDPSDRSAPIVIQMVATDKDGGVSTRSVTIQVPGTGIPTPIVRDLGLIDTPSLLRAYVVPETPDVRTTIPNAPTAISDRRFIAQQITTTERWVELRKVTINGLDETKGRLSLTDLDELTEFLQRLPDGRYRLYLKESDFTIPRMLIDVVVFRGRAVGRGDLQADRPPRQFLVPATETQSVPPVAKTPGPNDTSAEQSRGGGNGPSDSVGPSLSIPGPGLRGPGLRSGDLGNPAFPELTLPPASTPEFNELRGRAP